VRSIHVDPVALRPQSDEPQEKLYELLRLTEQYCVVNNTLQTYAGRVRSCTKLTRASPADRLGASAEDARPPPG